MQRAYEHLAIATHRPVYRRSLFRRCAKAGRRFEKDPRCYCVADANADTGTVEGEWRQYRNAFVGVAEELCGRTSGKGSTPRSRNQEWWAEEVAKAVGEKREAWKMIECIKDRGEQPPTSLKHMYGQKKKAVRWAVDRARRSMEEELYRKFEEDGGKKMIFKLARDRTEDGRDVNGGAVRSKITTVGSSQKVRKC